MKTLYFIFALLLLTSCNEKDEVKPKTAMNDNQSKSAVLHIEYSATNLSYANDFYTYVSYRIGSPNETAPVTTRIIGKQNIYVVDITVQGNQYFLFTGNSTGKSGSCSYANRVCKITYNGVTIFTENSNGDCMHTKFETTLPFIN